MIAKVRDITNTLPSNTPSTSVVLALVNWIGFPTSNPNQDQNYVDIFDVSEDILNRYFKNNLPITYLQRILEKLS